MGARSSLRPDANWVNCDPRFNPLPDPRGQGGAIGSTFRARPRMATPGKPLMPTTGRGSSN